MRKFFPFLLFFIVLLAAKCKKEYSFEGNGTNSSGTPGNTPTPVRSEWEFMEGGEQYKGPVDTAYLTKEDNFSVLTVTGISQNGAEKIAFKIRGVNTIEKGKTYATSRSEVSFLYTGTDTIYFALPYEGGDIYLTITSLSETEVTGTFKGLALKHDGRTYEIKEGKFSSPLKRVAATEAKGYIMLWATEGCNGPIQVKVNNQAGHISRFTYQPNCGDNGTATFTLRPGIYNWVAYCGSDSVSGKAEAKAGSCTKIRIQFSILPSDTTITDPAKVCKVSSIAYRGDLFPIMANTITTTYSDNSPSTINHTVSIYGFLISFTYAAVYVGNKVSLTHSSGSYEDNYFMTDGTGRVTSYTHSMTPDQLPAKTIDYVTYEYNANNQLVKRTLHQDAARRPISEMVFTWEGGNITKMTQTSLINGASFQYLFDYYPDKIVTAMPFFFTDVQELLMYQSLVNFGQPVKNLPRKMRLIINPTTVYTYSFTHVVDDNGYVQNTRLQFDGDTKYIQFEFGYHCQ